MSLIEAAISRTQPARAGSLIERAAARVPLPRPEKPLRPSTTVGQMGVERASSASAPARRTFTPDWRRLRKLGLLTPDTRRTRLAEEVRLIKRQLLRALGQAPSREAGGPATSGQVVVVTSSRPDEGKTFTTINLGLSLAIDEGIPVTLVDGDPLRPSISVAFQAPRSPGLTDLLLDEKLDPGEALQHAADLPLALLSDGRPVPSATELFGGRGMIRLLQKLTQVGDGGLVLIDTPPLLSSTETLVLAPHADAVLFVVEAGRTSPEAVTAALELLPSRNNVSLILNKCSTAAGLEQFGSYYSDRSEEFAVRAAG